jgi:RND family efflux transporter MFP subunit
MTPRLLRISFVAIVTTLLPAAGHAQSGPSVLVQLTSLREGSLPRVVTAYGRVQAGPSARQTVMAPLSAVVQTVYVRPGEKVAKGAPLLRLMPSPMATASYVQAESALHVTTELVARTRQMVGQHLVTAQQLADAEKSAVDARATLNALLAQGADGPKDLRAPFDAIVTSIASTPGSIVAVGAALLDLIKPEGLVLQVGVVPAQAASVVTGEAVKITPIGDGASLQATVSQRGSVVETSSGLVPVQIAVPADKLFAGEMAQADITTGQTKGYLVPHAAILVDDQGKPYVVQSVNMIAKKVPVQVLGSEGDKNVIAGQLDPATPLVLSGNYQLNDGMKMRVAQAGGKAAP